MNSSTYPSNSTSASPTIPASPGAMPAKAPSDTRFEQRTATVDESQNKRAGTFKQLGQRWKNMFNLKEQLQRHRLAAVLGGIAVALGIGGGITIGVLMTSQRRKSFSYRFNKGLRQAKSTVLSPLH